MKREFLQNLKVGEHSLPKEVIDAILDEHSRSIGNLKADLDAVKDQLKVAKDGLKAFEGVDVQDLQDQILKLQQNLTDKDAAHQAELQGMVFDQALEGAIAAANGRNSKAIKALLDMDALRGSEHLEADIQAALESLRKDNGYLFDDGVVPPPYAGGTGAGQLPKPHTLVGALRERYGA